MVLAVKQRLEDLVRCLTASKPHMRLTMASTIIRLHSITKKTPTAIGSGAFTQTMDKIGTLMSKDAVHRTILTIRS